MTTTTTQTTQHQSTTVNQNAAAMPPIQAETEQTVSMAETQNIPLLPRPDTRRKKSKKTVEVPMFLRKTYHMINAPDQSIVCWSKDGKSFIIKDAEKFASKVIPQFFNHKNFKSFVRQLNFYGFHKMKSDRIRKDETLDKLESKHWRFKHEHFQRGRPDLLEEIQKSKHNAVASQEEVDSLKDEVKELKSCIAVMAANIGKLNTFIDTIAIQRPDASGEMETNPSSPRKRRRVEADAALSSSVPAAQAYVPQSCTSSMPVQQIDMESFHQLNAQTGTLPPMSPLSPLPAAATPNDVLSGPAGSVYTEQVARLNDTYKPGTIRPAKRAERMSSFGSIGSLNQEFFELFEDDLNELDEEQIIEKVAPDVALSSTAGKTDSQQTDADTSTDQDEKIWSHLHKSFATLPKAYQEFLVKHLDEAIASPNNLRHLVDTLSTSFRDEGYSIPSLVPDEA